MFHRSAKPSHYDKEAKNYDTFNEKNSALINRTLARILKKHRVKTVLDLTCGTGSQVFWLTKLGLEVTGFDINARMLKIARSKAPKGVKFLKGDMRTVKVGQFDAVITIFNAVGHLTKRDFEKAMRNIHSNLQEGGIYIFDIFNLNYLLKDNRITDLTIDWQKKKGDTIAREIQYSTIDEDGVLASYTTSFEQKVSKKPKIARASQTLQIYTAKQLREMLRRNGFNVLSQSGIDGSRWVENNTDHILTVARKITR